jgi:hypothetical protein
MHTDKYILIFLSVLIFSSYFFNLYYIDISSKNIEPLFIECIVIIAITLTLLYRYIEHYDYDKENPNALITGKNISGTVYSSYPNKTPGLGWIL